MKMNVDVKTINENITKLNESFQKRGEAWIELSRCLSVHEQNLPQELITAWGGFELFQREAKTIEAQAINGIEGKIKKARFFKKFDVVTENLSFAQFLLFAGFGLYIIFFPDNTLNCPGSPSRSCQEAVLSPVDSVVSN